MPGGLGLFSGIVAFAILRLVGDNQPPFCVRRRSGGSLWDVKGSALLRFGSIREDTDALQAVCDQAIANSAKAVGGPALLGGRRDVFLRWRVERLGAKLAAPSATSPYRYVRHIGVSDTSVLNVRLANHFAFAVMAEVRLDKIVLRLHKTPLRGIVTIGRDGARPSTEGLFPYKPRLRGMESL